MKGHWQPKDSKENVASDIRDWVRRYDSTAELKTLTRMSTLDLTVLMLVLRTADDPNDTNPDYDDQGNLKPGIDH